MAAQCAGRRVSRHSGEDEWLRSDAPSHWASARLFRVQTRALGPGPTFPTAISSGSEAPMRAGCEKSMEREHLEQGVRTRREGSETWNETSASS